MTTIFIDGKPLFDWKDLDDSFCQHIRAFSNTNGHVRKHLDQYNSDIETKNGSSHTILRPSRVSDNILSSPNSFSNQIQNAHEKEEIFDIFEAMAFRKIANRLRYLHEITLDCDPDDPAMQFASLIEMALFFSRFGKILPYPQIGICPDGTLQIEWNSPPACALVNFMPNGSVEFAGILENREPPLRLQGSGNKDTAMQMIKPILRAIP